MRISELRPEDKARLQVRRTESTGLYVVEVEMGSGWLEWGYFQTREEADAFRAVHAEGILDAS